MIITCSSPDPPMSQAQGVESGGLITSGHAEPSGARCPSRRDTAVPSIGWDLIPARDLNQ